MKAEKCEFHSQSDSFLGFVVQAGQVRADPEKVRAVVEWPRPATGWQLQCFLRFANFYRRFIRNYSRLALPLTQLISTLKPFCWSPQVEQAFKDLKAHFTSAPILVHPDTSRQFIVEVDASGSGVGVVLSQRSKEDGKLHPCAFFSCCLSPAEQNYDVGIQEFLAVKLALEEWRHWLEGAGSCFLPGPFFFLTYRPGSRNTKSDVLSHQYTSLNSPFIPGLPISEGNSVILIIVDRFSKAVHFVPLPKLPSSSETAQLMVVQVF